MDLFLELMDLYISNLHLDLSLLTSCVSIHVLHNLDALSEHEMQHLEMHLTEAFVIFPRSDEGVTLRSQLVEFSSFFIDLFPHGTDVGLSFIYFFINDLDLYVSLSLLLNDIIQLSLFIEQTKILIFDIFLNSIDNVFNFEFFFEVLFQLFTVFLDVFKTHLHILFIKI